MPYEPAMLHGPRLLDELELTLPFAHPPSTPVARPVRVRVVCWRIAKREWWLDRVQSQCEMFAYDVLKLAALGSVLALLIHHQL